MKTSIGLLSAVLMLVAGLSASAQDQGGAGQERRAEERQQQERRQQERRQREQQERDRAERDQEQGDEERQQRRRRADQPRGTIGQVIQRLQTIELSEEQSLKIKEVIEAYQPRFEQIQEISSSILSDEIRSAMNEAQRKAREEGLSGVDLRAAVARAVELSDEQQEALNRVNASQRELRSELTTKVLEILTEEQQQAFQQAQRRNRQRASDGDEARDGERRNNRDQSDRQRRERDRRSDDGDSGDGGAGDDGSDDGDGDR